mmetsp:Transcript_12594/g.15974  ORF Transcript_12594/g.15974 Transcript_12594/m.15974 type:complete len:355 (+) Transcript_12594:56-1120(+)|eukprot:CAMPEP_0203673012 /NCGR_PEP_ID=MMETSP0090-20130426/10352_1 /ASSEMBLY_ACC=CAM_ASM_001088 /TAXON_ID=426623 /ORGANISM="Chaetoceros affinis, Strain CCMP159" /LENGTH=354 /DNA_ID=CAMNT_0050538525 /DNA_START=56 /DNA_END=1120 /DNA_ORIENTATION=+
MARIIPSSLSENDNSSDVNHSIVTSVMTSISKKGMIKKALILVTLFQFVFVSVVWNNPSGRMLLARSTADKLVVYNAVRGPHNLAFIHHSRHTSFPKDQWDCLVYMYAKEDEVPDDDEHLRSLRDKLGCTVPRTPGVQWVTFLQFITPTLVANYDYIALILDDVMIPNKGEYAVDPKRMIENMENHNIQVMTPGIVGDTHRFVQTAEERGLDKCLVEVNYIETYLQLYSRDAWECYYKMLHYTTGNKNWFYDFCYKPQCPDLKLAQDFGMLAYHMNMDGQGIEEERPNEEQIIASAASVDTNTDESIENGFLLNPDAVKIRQMLTQCRDSGSDIRELKAISCPHSTNQAESEKE